ncbi:hypothetical protein [Streptomyces cinereoruber]|uniref:hypothetical protein n=1 Tax=Streptomyces cinereoruber TaxID=67260 RepID=UPI0036302685
MKGIEQIKPGSKRNALAHSVLGKIAAQETEKWGVTISPETLYFNSHFYPSPYTKELSARSRELYEQLKMENDNGKQYIDGIKESGKPTRSRKAVPSIPTGEEFDNA